eukprot:gene4130-5884_t
MNNINSRNNDSVPTITSEIQSPLAEIIAESFWEKIPEMSPNIINGNSSNNNNDNNNTGSINNNEILSTKEFLFLGNKIVCLLSLLAYSVNCGDKMLVFSQNLPSLDLIELFLHTSDWGEMLQISNNNNNNNNNNNINLNNNISLKTKNKFSKWEKGKDYLRFDGSVTSNNRQVNIESFNKIDNNNDLKLMLISTKAGNMGINLQSANRIVIFDISWNPVHDLQAIFRSYRIGQKKNVYVYRLVAGNTMEEKIYKKQVGKIALSDRVIDAKMPDNHFTSAETREFLTFDNNDNDDCDLNDDDYNSKNDNNKEKVVKIINDMNAKDDCLMEFVKQSYHLIHSIEDQGSYLVDNIDSHLNEEEQAVADAEYDAEIRGLTLPPLAGLGPVGSLGPVVIGGAVLSYPMMSTPSWTGGIAQVPMSRSVSDGMLIPPMIPASMATPVGVRISNGTAAGELFSSLPRPQPHAALDGNHNELNSNKNEVHLTNHNQSDAQGNDDNLHNSSVVLESQVSNDEYVISNNDDDEDVIRIGEEDMVIWIIT